jgi:RHS repeat-associated protein
MTRRFGWGGEVQGGAPYGGDTTLTYSYANNKRTDFGYDAAGNVTWDGAYSNSYFAHGQQATVSGANYFLSQGYDGDGLRGSKVENGATTYYLRSTVLGGAVVAEVNGSGGWQRGYVYAGGELLAIQQNWQLNWVFEDAVTKSQRVTDVYGNVISTIELDPYGANTNRSSNSAFQPQNFATYIRDGNGGQDAMARRYSVSGRFSQPDPYGGSYDFSDPQSFNRYAYVGGDPVNRRDPSGLGDHGADTHDPNSGGHPGDPTSTWTVTIYPGGFGDDGMALILEGSLDPWLGPIGFGGGPGGGGGGIDQKPKNNSTPLKPAPTPTPNKPTPTQVVKKVNDTTRQVVRKWKQAYGQWCQMYDNHWWGYDTQFWINPFAANAQKLHCMLWEIAPVP